MQTFPESRLLANVPASQSIASAQRARDLIAAGRDVLSIVIGEPDFPTPTEVIDAAAQAAHQGQTRYTPVAGTPALRQAVAAKFERDNRLQYDPGSEIIVGTGAKQLIYGALMASLNPGDEVIVCTPYWVSYPTIARLAGATPVFIDTRPEHGFVPTSAQLRAAITTKTRWLILNYPNNPSGAIASLEQYAEIAQVLHEHPQVLVLSDEIYEHICYDGVTVPSFAAVSPAMQQRTLVVNGVSKAYGMTGWRIGFAGGPKTLISTMAKLQSHMTGGASAVSQAAALAALSMDQGILDSRRAIYQRRRDLVLEQLRTCPALHVIPPQGAFYVFVRPDVSLPDTATSTADYLLEHGVAVAPGEAFGAPGWFRMSIAVSDDTLRAACTRIINAFD